jgi:hypothetical protein
MTLHANNAFHARRASPCGLGLPTLRSAPVSAGVGRQTRTMETFLSVPLMFVAGLALGVWAARKAKSLAASDPAFGPLAWSDLFKKRETHTTMATRRSIAIYVLLAAAGLAVALLSGLVLLGASVRVPS